jgi:gluconolactonase
MSALPPEIELPWTLVARGIEGAEGPCFDAGGQFFCVASNRGEILRLTANGNMAVHADTEGIPAGLALSPDGRIFVADMRRGLLAIHPSEPGRVYGIAETFCGAPIRGCNDLCFHPLTGACYFTAPGESWEEPEGELFSWSPDGRINRVDGGFRFCNGIAISETGRHLLVAETRTRVLWRYDLGQRTSDRNIWAVLPRTTEPGGPDGIEFSPDRRYVLATNWNEQAIELFDWPTGRHAARLKVPFARPSNLEFSPDGRSLWVTEHTNMALWKASWPPIAADRMSLQKAR